MQEVLAFFKKIWSDQFSGTITLMVEAPIIPFPLQAPRESRNPNLQNSEILPGFTVKEAAIKTVAAGLIIFGMAIILDGSINKNALEAFGGGVLLGIGLYALLKKSS